MVPRASGVPTVSPVSRDLPRKTLRNQHREVLLPKFYCIIIIIIGIGMVFSQTLRNKDTGGVVGIHVPAPHATPPRGPHRAMKMQQHTCQVLPSDAL